MSENPGSAGEVKPPPAGAIQYDSAMDASGEHQEVQMYGRERQEMNGEEHDGVAEVEGMDADHPTDLSNLGDHIGLIVPPIGSNQLTLSFQGEVYVFDSVSPEKVQAVLLLLGGREIAGGLGSLPSSSHSYKRSNFPQRVASLMRFREKRKERNFDKKIRYTVRKEVALRMQRNKGQFTSSKSKTEDVTSTTSWDTSQRWGADDRPQAAVACHHCGINAKSTPMMRRGPNGPRTLCNACGLMWANKGTLRDLSKNPTPPPPLSLPELKEGNGTSEARVEQQPSVITANGHNMS
ncbi:GATA transcription factor 20-like isoform X1 [Dioscorea cayenensis subsp. rotundata]|uniref:GATA transcription factor 20-like isoform X1 n=1 Tax=Dioscorea cayennensis subsp. rotundata TaxID=55577 RepID=A0AB40BVL0_DIOCR|nr:GATA transcription factor 20-like isoform X1 [Dioscorea cayenensis subsp. rotundata]